MADFNADRFRELVLYIAWSTRGDAQFGRTKMAKALFYSDFQAYAEEGHALTAAEYQHWKFGPFPPVLYDVENELVSAGLAELRRGVEEGDEHKLVVRDEPETPHVEAWQKALVDMKISAIAPLTAKQVSRESHDHPGWELTRDLEVIPYETALIPDEPSEQAREIALRRFGHAAA